MSRVHSQVERTNIQMEMQIKSEANEINVFGDRLPYCLRTREKMSATAAQAVTNHRRHNSK